MPEPTHSASKEQLRRTGPDSQTHGSKACQDVLCMLLLTSCASVYGKLATQDKLAVNTVMTLLALTCLQLLPSVDAAHTGLYR